MHRNSREENLENNYVYHISVQCMGEEIISILSTVLTLTQARGIVHNLFAILSLLL